MRLNPTDICWLYFELFGERVEVYRADVDIFHGEFFGIVLVLDVGFHGWVRVRYMWYACKFCSFDWSETSRRRIAYRPPNNHRAHASPWTMCSPIVRYCIKKMVQGRLHDLFFDGLDESIFGHLHHFIDYSDIKGIKQLGWMMINKGVGIIWDHTVAGKFETFY